MTRSAAAVDPKQNRALHRRIRADLERKIVTGAWPPGHRIPFEHELVVQYRCSRMTVNKVLSGLASIGLLERRRRAGSFVSRPKVQSAVLEIPDIQAEIVGRGQEYGFDLIEQKRRRATKPECAVLGLEKPADVIAIICRHSANGVPFAYEERLINSAAVPKVLEVDFSSTAPGTWLLGHVPWTQAEHRIMSLNAGKDFAKGLRVKADTACLLVERRTWRAGEIVTFVRQVFPGNLYCLATNFTPTQNL
jgi:GntR family histidine utilization transcriptional repressor